jgi:hypothetical protein
VSAALPTPAYSSSGTSSTSPTADRNNSSASSSVIPRFDNHRANGKRAIALVENARLGLVAARGDDLLASTLQQMGTLAAKLEATLGV